MTRLGRAETELQALGALATATEIEQQPLMWMKTQAMLSSEQQALDEFLRPLLERRGMRVILAGAGTSGFIGQCLAPYFAARLSCRVESIPTTDLVCAPQAYLQPDSPTLLVSFARSGNSPESVAAFELANRLVREIHHLVVTCNAQGMLASKAEGVDAAKTIVLPEETHDRSFAMTSSFTAMTYAMLAAFSGIERMEVRLAAMADAAARVIAEQTMPLRALAARRFDRVVYLGSHLFNGLAREAALKALELTDGNMLAAHDSCLGFRHGPKTMLTERTLVAAFVSNDAYTRRYDLDLLEEIVREGQAGCVMAISVRDDGLPAGIERILLPELAAASDVDLLLPFIVAPQIFAFEASLDRGLSPDRPNRSGTVNRVVQGVHIYPLAS